MTRLHTPEEVAGLFRVTVKTLYQWRYRGIGPKSIKIEGALRYSEAAIQDYLKRQEAAS
jgi:predicted site-specific integrase-resolvase